jgi:hypothetical protein
MPTEVGADLFKDLYVISYFFARMFLQEGWFQLALPLFPKNEIVGLMGPTINVDDNQGR